MPTREAIEEALAEGRLYIVDAWGGEWRAQRCGATSTHPVHEFAIPVLWGTGEYFTRLTAAWRPGDHYRIEEPK